MNILSPVLRLFETADQEKARIVSELSRLRAVVEAEKSSATIKYNSTPPNQKEWVRIGKLERRLATLNGTIKVGK